MSGPENGGFWGVLGGAFDPVHLGHLRLAQDVYTIKKMNGVIFVPSFNPPRRLSGCFASFEDRISMLKLAIRDKSSFKIDCIENEFDCPGYTLLTIRALKAKYPTAQFCFIIGADILSEIDSWYQVDQLFEEVKFIAGYRPGSSIDPNSGYAKKVEIVQTSMNDIASSSIRSLIAGGISKADLSKVVPTEVAEYIITHGLYQ